MSDEPHAPDFANSPGEKSTVLFMQMVFQLSSLATMLLGKVPHPETGETKSDLEAAQLVIDQLDMLEAKTKGNLNSDEEQLLKQTLMSLRMAYVEAVNTPPQKESGETKPAEQIEPQKDTSTTDDGKAGSPDLPKPEPADTAESKKRFTKKY